MRTRERAQRDGPESAHAARDWDRARAPHLVRVLADAVAPLLLTAQRPQSRQWQRRVEEESCQLARNVRGEAVPERR